MFIRQIENGIDLEGTAKNIAAIYDTSLPPGESIPLHFHPRFEEMYYVLSGYGEMTIGKEKKEIIRNDVVLIPPEAPHSLLNSGNVPLRFITISVIISPDRNKEALPYIG